jgi:NADPH-dependent curcumin reductase CurA
MTPKRNRQVVLKSRPVGIPQAKHFAVREAALRELRDGELLVRNDFLSVDPAMRGWVPARCKSGWRVWNGSARLCGTTMHATT